MSLQRRHVLAWIAAGAATPRAFAGSYEAFFDAIIRDDAGDVRALLARGMDPNTVDPNNQAAIFVAMRRESLDVARVLAEHPKLDARYLNGNGESALMIAALRGHVDIAKRLIEQGAAVNKDDWTPLHYGASGPSTPVVQLLVDEGAEVNAVSPNRTTPLMMAAGYGPEPSIDVLLAHGADVARRNERQLSAGDFARKAGRDKLAERLDSIAKK